MTNYVIINADKLQKRIDELENYQDKGNHIKEIFVLKQVLSNSIPLIPEIEKAFIQGSHFKEKYVKEIHLIDSDIILQEPDTQKYTSQLKLKI